jgi:hypothetical protein
MHTSPGNHIASYAETVSTQGIGYLPLDRVTVKNSWRHSSTPVFRDVVMNGKGGHTLETLPRTVTPYRDNVDGTRDHVTYQKLVTR